jgi:hypothetical protein
MRTRLLIFLSFLLIFGLFSLPLKVHAANGLPGYPKFGYGARLNVNSPHLETALHTAGNLDLDWLAVDFNLAELWSNSGTDPNFTQLDAIMSLAKSQELSVLVSITNPPTWLITDNGPDPDLIAALASNLASRYTTTLLAIEPFPGANTQSGWGAKPDPNNYSNLLQTIHHSLIEIDPEIVIVAAGLQPAISPSDIDDLAFLNSLYELDCAPFIPVVGIRLINIPGVPTQSPKESDSNTLRHYEAVREVMLKHQHQNGLIWVTGFSWDSSVVSSQKNQAIWLKQALLMMRAQLYIGTAFVQNLDPFSQIAPSADDATEELRHPGIDVIQKIIAFENSQHTVTFETGLYKSSLNQIVKKSIP